MKNAEGAGVVDVRAADAACFWTEARCWAMDGAMAARTEASKVAGGWHQAEAAAKKIVIRRRERVMAKP